MTVGLIQYEAGSFDMDLKQINGHASHTLTAQPNFAADGLYFILKFAPRPILLSPYLNFRGRKVNDYGLGCHDKHVRKFWAKMSNKLISSERNVC